MVLVFTQKDIDHALIIFNKHDPNQTGFVHHDQLRLILNDLGEQATDNTIIKLLSLYENHKSQIDFSSFLKIYHKIKDNERPEEDIQLSFVACGGNEDLTGHVDPETLIRLIKTDFCMTFDIERAINKFINPEDPQGISFQQFKELFTT